MWRKTPQTILIKQLLVDKGHATNQELAKEARKTFQNLTNTSVHRITSRLVAAKMASYAPNLSGVKVIDANITNHDHFACQVCGKLIDIKLSDKFFDQLQDQLPGKLSHENMLVAGVCKKCECD